MYVVVDSGSTKADWMLVDAEKNKTLIHTMGLNPYFHQADKVEQELNKSEFQNSIKPSQIKEVHFYGAGCSDAQYCQIMQDGLKRVFKNAMIKVEHDLLGAARATCGHQSGIAGILGTGSNSCLYDGKQVTDNITALAHVLGDDGGGVHLGKLILQAYFYRELPKDLEDAFNQKYPEGKRAIIHRIYGEGQNVEISKFAEFLINHKNNSFARGLINEAFTIFTKRHLKKYEGHQKLPINFVGSVAFALQDELAQVLKSEGLKLGTIIKRPIDKLAEYRFGT